MLKGKTVIELTDVHTGKKEHYEDTNLVTEAAMDVLNCNIKGMLYNGTTFNGSTGDDWMLPLKKNIMGGILLYQNALEERADTIYAPLDNPLIGYASDDANNTEDIRRGSRNLTESKEVDGGYRFVWDFATSQANGTISAICLSNTLFLNGTIAEESWFDDDITPALFKEELLSGSGDITVWINSPGGDCVAAAQIYNMLMDYKGNVTVKIDGIAASAASVIAMAGNKVMVSPVSMLMIHNPATMAFGDSAEMQKAISMLEEVKESIINAYEIKTGLSRAKISHLMDAETWMNANMAIELGFADEIMKRDTQDEAVSLPAASASFSRAAVTNSLIEKLATKCHIPAKPTEPTISERSVDSLMERLNLIKQHI